MEVFVLTGIHSFLHSKYESLFGCHLHRGLVAIYKRMSEIFAQSVRFNKDIMIT